MNPSAISIMEPSNTPAMNLASNTGRDFIRQIDHHLGSNWWQETALYTTHWTPYLSPFIETIQPTHVVFHLVDDVATRSLGNAGCTNRRQSRDRMCIPRCCRMTDMHDSLKVLCWIFSSSVLWNAKRDARSVGVRTNVFSYPYGSLREPPFAVRTHGSTILLPRSFYKNNNSWEQSESIRWTHRQTVANITMHPLFRKFITRTTSFGLGPLQLNVQLLRSEK